MDMSTDMMMRYSSVLSCLVLFGSIFWFWLGNFSVWMETRKVRTVDRLSRDHWVMWHTLCMSQCFLWSHLIKNLELNFFPLYFNALCVRSGTRFAQPVAEVSECSLVERQRLLRGKLVQSGMRGHNGLGGSARRRWVSATTCYFEAKTFLSKVLMRFFLACDMVSDMVRSWWWLAHIYFLRNGHPFNSLVIHFFLFLGKNFSLPLNWTEHFPRDTNFFLRNRMQNETSEKSSDEREFQQESLASHRGSRLGNSGSGRSSGLHPAGRPSLSSRLSGLRENEAH